MEETRLISSAFSGSRGCFEAAVKFWLEVNWGIIAYLKGQLAQTSYIDELASTYAPGVNSCIKKGRGAPRGDVGKESGAVRHAMLEPQHFQFKYL